MAQQQPPASQPPQPPQHLWEDSCASRQLIAELYEKGPHHPYKDIVYGAWFHICMVYFHNFGTPSGGPIWAARQGSYKGLPPDHPSKARPGVAMIRVTPDQPGQNPPKSHDRDYLWVECKAATQDNPHGWKDVLRESVDRLAIAHANRMVFLIISIGYKCMWFVWDPLNQRPAQPTQPKLFIRRADGTGTWPIDGRIKPVQPTAWMNTTTGEVICENAMELECWKTVQIGGQNVLQNINNLTTLEQFLISVRDTPLQGVNPPSF